MRVRIRFGRQAKIAKKRRTNQRVAVAVAALLTPAAAMALVLGLWRIAAGYNWTGSFAISSGFFSHAQVWLATAAVLQLFAHVLNRYGKNEERATP